MTSRFPIEIQPELGYVRLGGVRLAVAESPDGALHVDNRAQVRAVTLQRRQALLLDALAEEDAPGALEQLLLEHSVIEAGGLDKVTLSALSLALAGGSFDGTTLAEAASIAAQRENWSWEQTLAAPAWVVDRAAAGQADDGWSTFVFPSEVDLAGLTREMALNLLQRGMEPMTLATPGSRENVAGQARFPHPEGRKEATDKLAVPADDGERSPRLRQTPTPSSIPPLHVPDSRPEMRAATLFHKNGPGPVHKVSWQNTTRPADAAVRPQSSPPPPSARIQWTLPAPSVSSGHGFDGASRAGNGEVSPLAQPATSDVFPTRWRSPAALTLETVWPAPQESVPVFAVTSGAAVAPTDWMDDLAQALEAECDLRGID